MHNRFILEEVLLENIHPNWPGGIFFKIKDTTLNHYRLGMYTTKKSGLEALEKVRKVYD